MANVLLTQKCVRSCPYCFAKKHMADSAPDDILSWENLIYIADLFEISGSKNISLLGGEPTLHPHFADFVTYLLARNFHINVFTNGILSEKMLGEVENALTDIHPDRITFICNLNDPQITPSSEIEKTEKFLTLLGHFTTLGFNVYRTDFKMDFLFQYFNRFGLKRQLRIGLAHPIPGKKNICIPVGNLSKVVDTLMANVPILERLHINMGFDCGIPMCLFSDDQLGKLFKVAKGRLCFECGPVIDIGPDMNVWSCFPLSSFNKKSLYEFDSIHHIHKFYHDLTRKIREETSGVYEKCDLCSYRETGLCSGGCMAHILSQFYNEAPIRMPEIYQ